MLVLACRTQIDEKSEGSIVWQNPTQLRWKHFQKVNVINDSTKAIANANTGFDFIGLEYSNSYKLHIYAMFDPKQSKVLLNGMDTKVLNHEQMHFNIAELYTRKYREAIINTPKSLWNFKYFDYLFDSVYSSLRNIQDLYDKETLYGSDSIQQKRWDAIILAQLDSTNQYRSRKIKLHKKRGQECVVYDGKKYSR